MAGDAGGIEQILREIRAIKERLDALEKALIEREEVSPEIILDHYARSRTGASVLFDVLE
ncbi:MAG: hypothetical protein ACK4GQ_00410 [Candidatus Hadarchaeales archaeon]